MSMIEQVKREVTHVFSQISCTYLAPILQLILRLFLKLFCSSSAIILNKNILPRGHL